MKIFVKCSCFYMTRCKQACKMLSGFVQSRLYISLFNPSPWWSPRLGQRHRRRLEPWFLRLRWVLLSPTNDIYCSGSGFSPSWPYAYHGRLEGIEGVWKPSCGYARTKCWASMRVIESVQPMHTKKKEYPRKLGLPTSTTSLRNKTLVDCQGIGNALLIPIISILFSNSNSDDGTVRIECIEIRQMID